MTIFHIKSLNLIRSIKGPQKIIFNRELTIVEMTPTPVKNSSSIYFIIPYILVLENRKNEKKLIKKIMA